MSQPKTQLVDLRGLVIHQSEDKASWKAEIMGEMQESLEGIAHQHLERIRDYHHRLLLVDLASNLLLVVHPLSKKIHELDRSHISLQQQVRRVAQELQGTLRHNSKCRGPLLSAM